MSYTLNPSSGSGTLNPKSWIQFRILSCPKSLVQPLSHFGLTVFFLWSANLVIAAVSMALVSTLLTKKVPPTNCHLALLALCPSWSLIIGALYHSLAVLGSFLAKLGRFASPS